MNKLLGIAASLMAALSFAGAAAAADKLLVGVALPRAQLGQGTIR